MSLIVLDARVLRSSTGRYHRELIVNLEKIDTKNTYIVLANSEDIIGKNHTWKPTSRNFSVLECNTPRYSLAEQTLFNRLLWKIKPDLVHFLMPQQPLGYRGKKIATVHDLNYIHLRARDIHTDGVYTYEAKRLVFKFFLKRISRTNNAIITPTEFTKSDLLSYTDINPNKIYPIYEGVATLSKTTKKIPSLVGQEFLLYVGQSSKYKGQLNLLKALQTLQEVNPDLRLALVGKPNSYTDTLKSYVSNNDIKNVDFLGFVSDEELAWLYKNTTCYVQPSSNEGFGLMNLEAMQYGAPVASSNATCLPEVCGDAAHYFDPTDVDDMAKAIGEVIFNPKLRKELIAKGNKQYKKYSWEKMAKETLAIYEKVLNS